MEQEIKSLDPRAAFEKLRGDAGAALIDVRSRMEFDYVGHPVGALNVPLKDYPDWQVPADFVVQVAAVTGGADGRDRPLLLLCRSGARSMAAAKLLAQAGYTDLTNVDEGFEGDKDADGHRNSVSGWRYHGLPWEQD
ncbi:MAG: rhodanese-like domain-containing protein [Gammaproteobacteria bacterium]|nr:rhodanese-like domain-containing protein [Gammaproteobacteria bacterium]